LSVHRLQRDGLGVVRLVLRLRLLLLRLVVLRLLRLLLGLLLLLRRPLLILVLWRPLLRLLLILRRMRLYWLSVARAVIAGVVRTAHDGQMMLPLQSS